MHRRGVQIAKIYSLHPMQVQALEAQQGGPDAPNPSREVAANQDSTAEKLGSAKKRKMVMTAGLR